MALTTQTILNGGNSFLVGVTGGGLYKSGLDYNSAALLKEALPDFFAREGKPDIKILKVTENLPSEYQASQDIIQQMWNGNASIYNPAAKPGDTTHVQLMVHLGMRTRESNFCFETMARRDDFVHPDNGGSLPNPEIYKQGGLLAGCPDQLRPDFDINAAAEATRAALPDHLMRVSTDAGHNLCEWFFINSLAQGYKRGVPLHVAFVHVPPSKAHEDLQAGVEILGSYIGALTDQIEASSVEAPRS